MLQEEEGGFAGLDGKVLLNLLAFLTTERGIGEDDIETITFLDVGEAGEKWTKAIQGAFIILAVVTDSILSRPTKSGAPS